MPSHARFSKSPKNPRARGVGPYAPGDYEAIISQRPIAIHALEHPTKFDLGLYTFRRMLRDALRGTNPDAAPACFVKWLRSIGGAPNSYCSGNMLEIPEAETVAQEVTNRRRVARGVIDLLSETDGLHGQARAVAVRDGLEALERSMGPT